MPAYLPNFNIGCKVWRLPNSYPSSPDEEFDCQLYVGSRGMLDIEPANPNFWVPPVYLRVPLLSDIRPGDQVECPGASGRLYVIRWVEDMHKGFDNEYRVGLMEQTVQPFPLP